MIARSAKLIFLTDITIMAATMISSLVGARALGPAGRGDLLVIVLWPPVIAMIAGLGLPTAYRYWMAKEPQRVSRLFSNAVVYTIIVGLIAVTLADVIVPHLVGTRAPQVMTLVRIYQINIPAALFLDLMRGLLEGTRRFGWAGAARLIFFGIQGLGFAGLWVGGHLTVTTACFIMIAAQASSMLLALIAVLYQLRPSWQPDWTEFRNSLRYSLRDYPGVVADYTTLRLDQLMLGGMASNVSIGLYVIAVVIILRTGHCCGITLSNAWIVCTGGRSHRGRAKKMSGRGYISAEEDSRCELCGKIAETRPYGPKGERVCFECGMKDEQAAKRQFLARVLGEFEA